MAIAAAKEKTRDLQRTLYRAAKADSRRRFHALHDKVHRRDVLERAWGMVRANHGAAGIDRVTVEHVERHGVSRLLDQLEADLKNDSYKAQPSRRVFIPKPGREERRPLSIPTVCDRIVQAAAKIDETWRGARWVLETDIASCFEEIPHERLMAAVEERIVDRKLLRLLRAMLGAGVMQEGAVRRSDAGTPQGGVISPLLANVYLHRLDRRWRAEGCGTMVRYADDLVVLCDSERDAHRALEALRAILADLGLRPKQAKTRIVHLEEGGPGFDFLGFHHRWVRGRTARSRHLCFLARWPSARAMQHARDRIRELTHRRRLLVENEVVVQNLNRFLRGWTGYFRYGNSARHLVKIRNYALGRLALFVAHRHKRSRDYGWWTVVHRSPDQMGLINLNGTIVAPRPNRPWRR
jgi:RNA-directed DNA polymerase